MKLDFVKLFKAFLGFWVLWVLLCLTLAGGLIYVIIHFLAKIW